MPKALKVDWGIIQSMFEEGVSLKNIAGRTGLPYNAICKRKERYNWRPLMLAPSDKPWNAPKSLTRSSRATAWTDKILDIVDSHLAAVSARSNPDVSLDDLEKLARITDATDRTARRTFGLDGQHVEHTHVMIGRSAPAELSAPSEVIDVDAVAESLPVDKEVAQTKSESSTNPSIHNDIKG